MVLAHRWRAGHHALMAGRAHLWLLAGCLLALTSCTSVPTREASVPPGSEHFLTVADMESVFGFRIARVDDHPPFTALPITEWPIDNHGPCSDSVQPPAVHPDTEYRYYVSVGAGAAELIGPADEEYTAFLDALHDDVSTPCDEFVRDDVGGEARTVTDIRLLDVSDLEPTAIAWSSRSSGGPFPGTVDFKFAMIVNGQFVFGGFQAEASDGLPSNAKLRQIVQLALQRLTA